MRMKRTNIKITRFEIGEFYVDIVETNDGIESWLCGKKYATSKFMFGMKKSSFLYQNFRDTYKEKFFDAYCELTVNNLVEHIEAYEDCIVR